MWVEIEDRIFNMSNYSFIYVQEERDRFSMYGKVSAVLPDPNLDDDGFDLFARGNEKYIKDLYLKLRSVLAISL